MAGWKLHEDWDPCRDRWIPICLIRRDPNLFFGAYRWILTEMGLFRRYPGRAPSVWGELGNLKLRAVPAEVV